MNNPLISIIIPCYNVESYLNDTADSIINQTYSNWELLLVDDGSKDRTSLICDELAKKDERIKVIHKGNGGLVSARNAGYEKATGDWLMYIDGDDWIDTDCLEELIGFVDKYDNPDIIFWNCVQELGEISIKGKWEWKCTDTERLYQNEECMMLSRNTLNYKSGIATAYSKLIKRDFCLKNDLDHNHNLRQGVEGMEFSMRVFAAAKKALFVRKYYNHYRYNPISISKKVDEQNTKYIHDGLLECCEYIDNLGCLKEAFLNSLYQRSLYALIAVALSTYFHPNNADSLRMKIAKFKAVVRDMYVFNIALKKADLSVFDKQRKIVIYIIKLKLYFLLPLVSKLKQYYLGKGKFDY